MRLAFGHLALFVPDLRAAERFYCKAFDLNVSFREAEADDGLWYTLPPGKDWDDAEAAGVAISMVGLLGDTIALPIFRGEPKPGTVLEIGLTLPTQQEVDELDRGLPEEVTRLPHEYGDLFFADPFGYTWHVYPKDERFLSNGDLAGHWLEI